LLTHLPKRQACLSPELDQCATATGGVPCTLLTIAHSQAQADVADAAVRDLQTTPCRQLSPQQRGKIILLLLIQRE